VSIGAADVQVRSVAVLVGVTVGVDVRVGVDVGVDVSVPLEVAVDVDVWVKVRVFVGVGVGVSVYVAVGGSTVRKKSSTAGPFEMIAVPVEGPYPSIVAVTRKVSAGRAEKVYTPWLSVGVLKDSTEPIAVTLTFGKKASVFASRTVPLSEPAVAYC
jgi:hypothetical protein